MRKILVHHPNMFEPPVGVWWLPTPQTKFPASYYTDDTYKMLVSAILVGKLESASWEDFFDYLADKLPYYTYFEVQESDEDPVRLLPLLQKVSKADLAQT